ncbi:fibronectin type III domain-containing protein [Thermotoga profunda]|uniref:fibronectin type III domain-containing protein n=1 Tax=Thermotoga profunda TaxID=1508420 RepID=UPI00059704B4|nr:fibronectin type III domain-containing protein [Thermotoga profunda]
MSKKWLLLIAVVVLALYGCLGPANRNPQVSLIYPEDGAQVAVLASTKAVTLKSTASDPEGLSLTFDVYLGTSASNLSKIATVDEPEYTVSDLTPGQTYYWKVVVSDGTNSVPSPVWSFTVGGNHSLIKVADFTTGPATVGAKVEILQNDSVVISDLTNSEGHAEFYLPDGRYDIKITGEGKATSMIYNYDPQIVEKIETLSRRQMTDNDQIPNLEVEILDQNNNVIPDPEATTITFDYIKVHVTSDVVIGVLYIGLDYTPSAVARDSRALNTYEFTTGLLDIRRFQDVTIPVHVVAYTPNDTRVDKLIYLTINRTVPEVTERIAPTGLWYYGWTSDVDLEYYSLPKPFREFLSKNMPKEMQKELENYKPEHNITNSNILVQLAWTHAPSTNRAGYNVYRSTDQENWEKIAFTTTYYTFDKAVDLVPGQRYYYTVRTVYRDGSESGNSNIIEVIPLDLFKVKLISPADNQTNVSRTPTFIWEPVDWRDNTSTPHIGGDLIDDENIIFVYYGPWIYDQAVSDQHIYYGPLTGTNGPSQISIPFDPTSGYWIRIYPNGEEDYQTEPLEKFKTYEWGLDAASAYYETDDGLWISTTIDYGYGFDRWTNEADYFNRFTTGEE